MSQHTDLRNYTTGRSLSSRPHQPLGEPHPDRGWEEQHRSLSLLARDSGGVGRSHAEFNEISRLTTGLKIDSSHILTLTNHR